MSINLASVTLKPAPKKAPYEDSDPRSDLLKAIRDGIKLRKVDAIERGGTGPTGAGLRVGQDPSKDVASILQERRFAFEVSDSDTSSDTDSDSDDWDETSA
ncbi:WH2 domain [Trinorchestia longiramus]|nr:WH2 domain [Trinorchestia longiramus]